MLYYKKRDIDSYLFNNYSSKLNNNYQLSKTYINSFINIKNNVNKLVIKNNKNRVDKEQVNKEQVNKEQVDKDKYIVSEEDKLYWIFYILKNNYDDYNKLNKKYSYEKDNKFKIIDILKNKDIQTLLKAHKLKYKDIIQNLGSDNIIDINTFKALCIIEKINIIIIHSNMCMIMENSDNKFFNIVELIDKNYYLNKNIILKDDIINKYYEVKYFDKPLKGLSSYKVDELKHICSIFNINIMNNIINQEIKQKTKQNNKQKTKQELYDDIIKYLKFNIKDK
jgi:hypothetical protein